MTNVPLLIDFVPPTSLLREEHRESMLPILGNGPPGTFVLFADGLRVSLPTDQITYADDGAGYVSVGFGGMRYVGVDDHFLAFARVRELFPEDQLSPARSHTMLLDVRWVARVIADGREVWPRIAAAGSPSR